ncbi:gliding motility-associated C-terminal domain-containing protein [Flavihumibacter fluvii]|uniref:T9SS type B sorting domain-containing protein n=1 Tax=Flavihumibacter fluvii TaxID=2838157 RepID=UPI001EFBBBD5|nr:gliding motility-associated C-terminal domain-containing protein [Flavihumibacter fluvii]ULQ54836.1 gliding motility-associated C-terminal domain-containing protein [Flavihumibacter fluvii]
MVFHSAISLISSWIILFHPADDNHFNPPGITGIEVVGDTCDISAAISFQLMGTSDATSYTWNFDDPGSGSNNSITVDGSRGNSNVSHQFSKPGRYEVHVTWQEPGMPEARLCKYVTIGQCCVGTNAGTTTISVCADQLPYVWNGSNYTESGRYTHSFQLPSGCDSVATLVLQVGNPTPSLGNDTTLCPGEKLLLDPGNYDNYLWQDLSAGKVFEVTQPGRYSVTVQNGGGCSGTDAIEVMYENNCGDIYFPSAITPNNDGKNDAFGALGNVASVSNYKLVVYNRYGQVVYSSSDPFQRWNGQNSGLLVANSNFVWNAAYSINGRSQKYKKGSLAVLK